LSVGDTFLTHLLSSVRIMVEHVIAGVKRCRIVKEVLRLTKTGSADMVMEMACGLHNLRVSCRHPLPTFDVLSLINSS
jgi:DDE superfamily endonuclease